MIWFFLMGMVAGAAGTVMYAHYWMRKHATVVRVGEETPRDILDEVIRTLETKHFENGAEVVAYLDEASKRMDVATKRMEDKAHE